jgi:WD40 repeat protein/serine/threonine protein kinase
MSSSSDRPGDGDEPGRPAAEVAGAAGERPHAAGQSEPPKRFDHGTDSIGPDKTIELTPTLQLPADHGLGEPRHERRRLRSLFNSRHIHQTISSPEFVAADAGFWERAEAHSQSESESVLPAIDRSLSETKLNLRGREIAPEHSPPEIAASADYRLLRLLGKGGMGSVYAAHQGSLDRVVALKVIKPLEGPKREKLEQKGELEKVERQRRLQFISEAVVTGDLEHPNIVPIHDIAIAEDDTLFYAMRRVTGTPWSDVIAKTKRDENLEILLKVCDAVGFAHTRGVVHRDIKPENIMLGEFGVVTVMDWGLALAQPGFVKRDAIFQSTGLGGSPAYMAPEMANGPVERIGPASDIYLLGATLFQIITGRAPHHGDNVRDCLRAVSANEIFDVPPNQRGELLDVALRAMATQPEDRYADVRSFQEAIRECRAHSESIALTRRAYEDARRGRDTRNYGDFSRAIFGFEEAVVLWDDNQRAASGLKNTKIAYAEAAYSKGDFDLGLSLLNAGDVEHQELIEKLTRRRSERRSRKARLVWLYRSVAAMLVFILIGGALALHQINQSATEARNALKQAELSASRALRQAEEARLATEDAREQEAEANTQRSIAITEAENARLARRKAEYESYISQIGSVKARLDQNDFDNARRLLEQLKQERGEDRLGWEWRWLSRQTHQSQATLSTPASVVDLGVDQSTNRAIWLLQTGTVLATNIDASGRWQTIPQFEGGREMMATALAVSKNTGHVALATTQGSIEIWDTLLTQRMNTFAAVGGKILALRYTPGGLLVAAAADHSARLYDPGNGTELAICRHHGPLTDIAVSQLDDSDHRLLVATAVAEPVDGYVICWELTLADAQTDQSPRWRVAEKRIFRGHRGAVLSVALSPDGTIAASGDALGECLLWKPGDVERADDHTLSSISGRPSGEPEPNQTTNQTADPVQQQFVRLRDLSQRNMLAAVSTSVEVPAFIAHRDAIHSLAFSAQADRLVSGSDDYTLKLWDVERGELIETFRSHGGWVRRVGFAQATNGSESLLVSGSSDATVRSWDLQQNVAESVEVLLDDDGARVRPHQDAIATVRFDATGKLILSAGSDQSVRITHMDLNRHSFSRVVVLNQGGSEHVSNNTTPAVVSVTMDRLSSRLFMATDDGVVGIWDVQDATLIGQLDATGLNDALAVTPEGRFLLTRSSDPDVACILWELPPGANFAPRMVREFRGHTRPLTALAISSDGRLVYTADEGGTGLLWDLTEDASEHRPIHIDQQIRINAAAFTQDRSHLWIGADDQRLTCIELESGETVSQFEHPGSVRQLALSIDDRYAVTLSEQLLPDHVITQATVWNLETGKSHVIDTRGGLSGDQLPADAPEQRGDGVEAIVSVSFGSTPSRVVLGLQSGPDQPSAIDVWDIDSDGAVQQAGFEIPVSGGVVTAALPIAAESLITLSGSAVTLWDLAAQRAVRTFRPRQSLSQASFSAEGGFVATAVGSDVTIWDLATAGAVARLLSPHDGPVHTAQFSRTPDSLQLATAGQDGVVRLWNWNAAAVEVTPIRQWELSGPRRPIRSVAFSPDGHWLVVAGDQGVVRVLPTAGEPTALTYDLPEGVGLTCVAFRSDGSWFAVGGSDSIVRIWPRVAPGESIPKAILLQGHTDRIEDVRFLEDGSQESRLLTASRDRTARVWDPRIGSDELLGREILALRRHRLGVTGVDMSPDGRSVITSGADGRLILWPADPRSAAATNGR